MSTKENLIKTRFKEAMKTILPEGCLDTFTQRLLIKSFVLGYSTGILDEYALPLDTIDELTKMSAELEKLEEENKYFIPDETWKWW